MSSKWNSGYGRKLVQWFVVVKYSLYFYFQLHPYFSNECNYRISWKDPFCGATDTPVLDFWWHLLWVWKPEWVLPYLHLAEAYDVCYMFPEIHLWCYTCWPLGGQHGCQADLFQIPAKALVGVERDTSHSMSERSTDWAMHFDLHDVLIFVK